MGVTISHDCFSGSCNSFVKWRCHVAKAAGFETRTRSVKLIQSEVTIEAIQLDPSFVDDEKALGKWNVTPPSPLLYLFAHSDCEGVILPEHAAPLAASLEEALPDIISSDNADRYFSGVTKNFINGLQQAAANNEAITFS